MAGSSGGGNSTFYGDEAQYLRGKMLMLSAIVQCYVPYIRVTEDAGSAERTRWWRLVKPLPPPGFDRLQQLPDVETCAGKRLVAMGLLCFYVARASFSDLKCAFSFFCGLQFSDFVTFSTFGVFRLLLISSVVICGTFWGPFSDFGGFVSGSFWAWGCGICIPSGSGPRG